MTTPSSFTDRLARIKQTLAEADTATVVEIKALGTPEASEQEETENGQGCPGWGEWSQWAQWFN